jgi:hypothetical protein
MAIHFMKVLGQGSAAWLGFNWRDTGRLGRHSIGGRQRRFCLTMSALDTLPDEKFSAMMPGLLAMFSKRGWMALLWGILLLPAGFAIQAVGLLQVSALPRWQSILFSDRRTVGGYPGRAGSRQSQRLYSDGNRLDPLWIQLIATAF